MRNRKQKKSNSVQDERKERIMRFIEENPRKDSNDSNGKSQALKKNSGLASCLISTPTTDQRLKGGTSKPTGKLPRTDSECQFNAPGQNFLQKRSSNVAISVLELVIPNKPRELLKNKCNFFPKYVDPRPNKDQTTQTLYRESSAQTLPYLPQPFTTHDVDQTLELFTLPTLLPGDGPPGLYEVDVLERARKRGALLQAMRTNMKLHQADARKLEFQKYKNLLQAFEWSEWIQREEYLQECQILRLEIVIKMLDKREREMHAASKTRIEQACERIEKRRQADLQKNEIEYQRGMRRITMQLAKTSRKWEKPDTLFALGSRCSEFYAPIRRYGVDPVRRNFEPEAGRRAFDMRIDKLEKQVNMNRLKCPFKKLKEWAEPKLPTHEYEQNFCSEANLQSLYEFLKRMRKLRDPRTDTPLCLKEKFDFSKINDRGDSTVSYDPAPQFFGRRTLKPWDKKPLHSTRLKEPEGPKVDRDPGQEIQYTDLEALISAHEGKVIGFLMEFLLEESNRMVEQRRLHAFAILSLKERWRREAIEGGNRQKENDLRTLYEDMFQQSISVNNDVADLFIKNILDTDVSAIAANEAAESMNEMALQIDRDIERWLESFKLIQNPLTFIPLRLMLRDMVSPDLDAAVVEHENAMIVQYIVDEVIFDRVWKALEPFDVGSTLTSDLIDRLIDNDLYLFSTDSESDSDHMPSWYEAQAIIRKLIRYSVPGKRWKEENERIVHDIYDDMLDDIFVQLILKYYPPTQERIKCQEYEEINEEEGTDLISIRSDLSTRSIFNVHSDLSSFDNGQDNGSERVRVMELTEDNNNLSSQKDVQDDWMCEIN